MLFPFRNKIDRCYSLISDRVVTMLEKKAIHNKIILINVFTAIIYIFVYRRVHVDLLVPYFSYTENNTSIGSIWFTNILMFVPILFYRARQKLSDFLSIMTYTLIFVPSMVSMQYHFTDSYDIPYQLAYTAAMIFFFKAGDGKISRQVYTTKLNRIPPKLYIIAGLVALLIILILFRNNLKMVSFEDVYDLRDDSHKVTDGIPLIGYVQMWLQTFFSPLFIAVGCYKNNKKLILLGFLMSLLTYMSTGHKSSLFLCFGAWVFYYMFKSGRSVYYIFPVIALGLVIPYISQMLFFADGEFSVLNSVLLMRTYGISDQLTPIYLDVFRTYPYTFYSHINIVNLFTGMYPFKNPSMGNAIWEIYTDGRGESNVNANFLITDGIATAGVVGVILASVFFYFLLCYLNKLSNRFEFNFVIALMVGIVSSFTNLSIFTTLLSSGLLLIMLFFRFSTVTR